MRAASTRLMGRERLGRDVFGRGDPEAVNVIKLRTYKDTLYDLLTAYATDRVRRLGGKTYRLRWRRCWPSRRRVSGWSGCWAGLPTGAP